MSELRSLFDTLLVIGALAATGTVLAILFQ